MKLSVRNLGRIESADIDIRPFTVFFGPNGTNKTWTVYALYGLLRELVVERVAWAGQLGTLIDSGLLEWAAQEEARLKTLVAGSLAPQTRLEFTAPPKDRKPVVVSLDAGSLATLLRLEAIPDAHIELEADPIRRADLNDLALLIDSPRRQASILAGDRLLVSFPFSGTPETAVGAALAAAIHAFSAVCERAIPMPAERKALTEMDDTARSALGLRLSTPALDYIEFARPLPIGAVGPGAAQVQLLSALLKGHVTQPSSARPVEFEIAGGPSVPLTAASSLVRALAGLAIYLERGLRPNDVLVIDELEMNAHPEAQLALVELMAILVNNGVRVVFTTHSPYVSDHINNLLLGGRLMPDGRPKASDLLSLKSPQAFLAAEQVAAWAFEEGADGKVHVRDAMDRKTGQIEGATFAAASNRVMDIFARLLDIEDVDLAQP